MLTLSDTKPDTVRESDGDIVSDSEGDSVTEGDDDTDGDIDAVAELLCVGDAGGDGDAVLLNVGDTLPLAVLDAAPLDELDAELESDRLAATDDVDVTETDGDIADVALPLGLVLATDDALCDTLADDVVDALAVEDAEIEDVGDTLALAVPVALTVPEGVLVLDGVMLPPCGVYEGVMLADIDGDSDAVSEGDADTLLVGVALLLALIMSEAAAV